MIQTGVAKFKNDDPYQAGYKAGERAMKQAGIEECDLVIVHANSGFSDYEALLRGVRQATGEAPLVGSLAGGVITQDGSDEDFRTLGVMVLKSDRVKFKPVLGQGLLEDSEAVGKSMAEQLTGNWPEDAKMLQLIPGGLSVNPDALFRGLEGGLPHQVPFVGGSSGGLMQFNETYQFYNEQVLTDSAVGVLWSGDFKMETGVSHGAVTSGLKKTITKAEGNRIYEYDNEPAFNAFLEFVPGAERVDLLTQRSICWGAEVPEELKEVYDEDVILRISLDVKDDNSLIVAAEWPEGTEIHICQRELSNVLKKTAETAKDVRARMQEKGGEKPQLVLDFECIGRAQNFWGDEAVQKMTRIAQDNLSPDAPWLGWYTYGEIAPVGEKNEFHNWTGVLVAIY